VSPSKLGVVAVLEDTNGRYLFIQRSPFVVRAPGVWCFVGGEVEPKESLHTALEREVFEEIGLRVQAGEKIHESISPCGTFQLHWLRATTNSGEYPLTPNPAEVSSTQWLAPREALLLDPILETLKQWLEEQVKNR